MAGTTPLRYAAKALTKELVWSLCRFRPDGRSIALFANRRGGSTWFMEAIAANRGVRYLDQPFSVYRFAPAHAGRLPVRSQSQFASLNSADEAQLRDFVEDLLEGHQLVNAPWEIWSPTFYWTAHRLVLKILAAKPLIDWFDRSFDVHIVYVTRHPIPTALSVMRNDWGLTLPAYLNDPAFAEAHLTTKQIDAAERILRDGSPLEQHVLNWTVENIVPLRLLPDRPHWLHLTYEEALLNPDALIGRMADALDLPDRDRMRKQVKVASRSTRHLDSTFDAGADAAHQLSRWRHHVSPDEERAAFRILDLFEIDCYRFGEDLPTEAQPRPV